MKSEDENVVLQDQTPRFSIGVLASMNTEVFQQNLAGLGSDVSGTVNTIWAGIIATNGNDSFTGTANSDYLRGLGGHDSEWRQAA